MNFGKRASQNQKRKKYFQKTYKSTDKPEKKVYYDIVQEELQIPCQCPGLPVNTASLFLCQNRKEKMKSGKCASQNQKGEKNDED